MRAVWLVGLLLAGCLEPSDAQSERAISWSEASGLLPSTEGWIVARAEMHEAVHEGALTGRAGEWTIWMDDDEHRIGRVYRVTEAGAVLQHEGAVEDRNAAFHCAVKSTVDSTAVAAALAGTEAWQWTAYEEHTPMIIGMDCLADTPHWNVRGPLQQNTDGSWAGRSFFFTKSGAFGGFIGDPSIGHPFSGSFGNGLNVDERMASLSLLPSQTATAASFNVTNAARLAIVAEPHGYQGLGMPLASGRVMLKDPAGDTYAMPFAFDAFGPEPVSDVLERLPMGAMAGTWEVAVEVDRPVHLGPWHVHVCTGYPYHASPMGNPACRLLQ